MECGYSTTHFVAGNSPTLPPYTIQQNEKGVKENGEACAVCQIHSDEWGNSDDSGQDYHGEFHPEADRRYADFSAEL